MSKSWKTTAPKMDRAPKSKPSRNLDRQADLKEIMRIVNRTGEKLEDLFD